MQQLPVTNNEISRETKREKVLSHVFVCAQNDWGAYDDNLLSKGYYTRRDEIFIHSGCLMWGVRVIVPVKLRECVLHLLHASHSRELTK